MLSLSDAEIKRAVDTHHVAVSVKSLHASKQLFVVSEGDENLRMIPYGLLKYGEGSLADFMFLEGA